jgi:tetratricopeptide (TPR) repeat protein
MAGNANAMLREQPCSAHESPKTEHEGLVCGSSLGDQENRMRIRTCLPRAPKTKSSDACDERRVLVPTERGDLMHTSVRRSVTYACVFLACLSVLSTRARAEDSNVEQARAHFGRGVQYYEDGDFRAALMEFERAYSIQHAFQLLYNLGQVSAELRDYAAAERYFREYLAKGGQEIAVDRRAEVSAELARLKARVGSIRVTANLPDVQIHVDDQVIKNPSAGPIRVSAGRRELVAEKAGYSPVRRVVEVLGGEELTVKFDMGSPLGAASNDSPNVLPWVAGVSSAVLLVAAGATGYWAYRDSSEYSSALNSVTTQDRLDQLSARAETKALLADVLLGTAIAGGVLTIIFVVTGDSNERASAKLKAMPVVRGSGLQLQF